MSLTVLLAFGEDLEEKIILFSQLKDSKEIAFLAIVGCG